MTGSTLRCFALLTAVMTLAEPSVRASASVTPPATAAPQALCSLRDPVRQIKQLFPESDGYQSIVGTIGNETRKEVARHLPFRLHFNELGRHTLYVALKGNHPLGLVHVRSEAGAWGIVEIAWSLDMELRVLGYEFQRCRDRSKRLLETPRVKSALGGRGFDGLRALVGPRAETLTRAAGFFPEKAARLSTTLVRSGLKTISVTESVWGDRVEDLRALALARPHQPAARSARRSVNAFDAERRRTANELLGEEGTGIDHGSSLGHVVLDAKERTIGAVAQTPWTFDDRTYQLRWVFDARGAIQSVGAVNGWKDQELAAAFDAAIGMTVDDALHCSSAAGLVALDVAVGLGFRLDDGEG